MSAVPSLDHRASVSHDYTPDYDAIVPALPEPANESPISQLVVRPAAPHWEPPTFGQPGRSITPHFDTRLDVTRVRGSRAAYAATMRRESDWVDDALAFGGVSFVAGQFVLFSMLFHAASM